MTEALWVSRKAGKSDEEEVKEATRSQKRGIKMFVKDKEY